MLAFGIPVLDQVVSSARVVAIYGEAGAGKTTLAFQALLTTLAEGGAGLLALSEPAVADRLADMAGEQWESVAERIYICELKRLSDLEELVEVAGELGDLRMVVVDGVDRIYRGAVGGFEKNVVASRVLNEQLSRLRALAYGREIDLVETVGVTVGRTPVAGEVVLRYTDLALEIADLGGDLRLLKITRPCCLFEAKLKLESRGFTAL